jgi:hypothetical protein
MRHFDDDFDEDFDLMILALKKASSEGNPSLGNPRIG